jgi:hypothetical protein
MRQRVPGRVPSQYPGGYQANTRAGMEARDFETECRFPFGRRRECARLSKQLQRKTTRKATRRADRVQLACRRSVLAMVQPNSKPCSPSDIECV